MREDVGEPQQQRRVQAAPLQRLHHLQNVDGLAPCVALKDTASRGVSDALMPPERMGHTAHGP